jgi:hypothetical protein
VIPQLFNVGQRKFMLTAYVLVVCTVALFTRFMTAAQFLWVVPICLGMYKVANVTDKRLGGAG